MRIAERIHQFDEERPFEPWLMCIVVNDALKSAQRQKLAVPLDEEPDEEVIHLARWLMVSQHQPDKALEIKESTQLIRSALQRLTPEQRAVIVMRYFLDMKRPITRPRRAQVFVFATLLVLVGIAATLATPQGRSLAQEILQFFTRADSDTLPVQSWQLTPLPETTAPDPGDINNASLTVSEVEDQLGMEVLEPTWLPKVLSFVGANLEPEHQMALLFYRYAETNELVLREEPVQISDACDLCGSVGASAAVETVQIGNVSGEYVEGVWKLTEDGPVWIADPYLKTLRWQANGMAFELLYMGPPDSVTKTDLIAIAESLK